MISHEFHNENLTPKTTSLFLELTIVWIAYRENLKFLVAPQLKNTRPRSFISAGTWIKYLSYVVLITYSKIFCDILMNHQPTLPQVWVQQVSIISVCAKAGIFQVKDIMIAFLK